MAQRFLPKKSQRGSKGYYYFEISLALGPEAIGVTGDNRYETLYGREYLLILAESDNTLHLYREDATDGEWTEITSGLPSGAFGSPLPAGAKQVTFAFDQSARINLAYEVDGHIYVTRWDNSSGAYIQNVDFDGHDPAILMDATILDPRGYPTAADDGWSVREAYEAGGDLSVAFKWLAEDPSAWRTSPITDSDVLIFYLTPDRTGVRARVQRQLYATVNTIHDFADPIILDRAIALYAKYELLVSDTNGDPLSNMLISTSYVDDWLIIAAVSDTAVGNVSPEGMRAEQTTFEEEASDALDSNVSVETIAITGDTVFRDDEDAADADVSVEDMVATSDTIAVEDEDALDSNVAVEDPVAVVTTTIVAEDEDALDSNVTPEAIRVQTV